MDKLLDKLLSEESLFNIFRGLDTFSIESIIFSILVTTLLGLFIYFVYKKTFTGVLYSQNFNITIVMICIVTAIVMMLIRNNLALSLGMVGSLSIIRFRTAIKDPRDIGFLFWAIAIGLAAGTGQFVVVIIGSIFISLILFIYNKAVFNEYSFLLILKGTSLEAKEIAAILKEYGVSSKLRMKTLNSTFMEATYEINLKTSNEDSLIRTLRLLSGVEEVHIVSFNGEISG